MLLDYLAVEYCRDCGEHVPFETGRNATICANCWRDYSSYQPQCELLSNGRTTITVVTAVDYNERVKALIHRLKYMNDRLIADDLVLLLESAWWKLAEDWLPEMGGGSSAPYVVPVPLHWTRFVWRGFNQAELLSEGLSDRLGLFTDSRILSRSKFTRPHHGLNRAERAVNVRSAFRASSAFRFKENIPPIVLVDDIFTSGATLLECSEALFRAGFLRVAALAVSRA
jgi:ComF family protein